MPMHAPVQDSVYPAGCKELHLTGQRHPVHMLRAQNIIWFCI